MIKKLLLTFTFVTLVTIAFDGITYSAHAGETVVVSEELVKLHDLYKEGIITEEEFSKAKSILLNPDFDKLDKSEKKKWGKSSTVKKKKKKKKKLTAVERRELERLEEKKLKDAIKAKREGKREERKRLADEEELMRQICKEDPEVKCPSTILRTLKKLNVFN